MSKRVVVTVTAPDQSDVHALADILNEVIGAGADATVWEWNDFWADVANGKVGPHGDPTTSGRETGSEEQQGSD